MQVFYSLISSLKIYHRTLHFTPLVTGLVHSCAISVLPGTHFHLSQVKHLMVKCLAQGHNNVQRLRWEKHEFSLKILHQAGFETARQAATSAERHALTIAPCPFLFFSRINWGTGMIASSSTFRPHSGRVIRDLFRLLDAVTALYGSTRLQQSSKGSCSLLVSGYNLRADCQWRTLVPPLNSGANAAPASVLALM